MCVRVSMCPGVQACKCPRRATSQGMTLHAYTPVGQVEVRTPLLGQFNCYNILASMAAAHALGIEVEKLSGFNQSILYAPKKDGSYDWNKGILALDPKKRYRSL